MTHSSVPFSASPEQKLGITHTTKEGLTLSRGPNGELHATIQNESNDLGIGYVRKNGAFSTETHWTKIYDQIPGGRSSLNAVKMAGTYSLTVAHQGDGRTTLNVVMDGSVEAMKIQVGNKVYLLRESDIKALDTKTTQASPPVTPALSAPASQSLQAPSSPAQPPQAAAADTAQPKGAAAVPMARVPSVKPTNANQPSEARGTQLKPLEPEGPLAQKEGKAVEPKTTEVAKAAEPAKADAPEGVKSAAEAESAKPGKANAGTDGSKTEVKSEPVQEQISESGRRKLTVEEVARLELPGLDQPDGKFNGESGENISRTPPTRPSPAEPTSGKGTPAPSETSPVAEPRPLPEPARPAGVEPTVTADAGHAKTGAGKSVVIKTEAATAATVELPGTTTNTAPTSTAPDTAAPAAPTVGTPVTPEPSINSRLIEGLKTFNQNLRVSEWARNNQFKAMTYAAAVSEAVTGAMKANYGPNDNHSPVPRLLTLLNTDIQKGLEFTTQQGGLSASVLAEATRSAGDTTIALGAFATVDTAATAASTTRIGQILGGRTAATAFSRTLGVVGVAYHGYSTFSDGSFVQQNDLQLAGSTASPVVMGAIIGAPLGPIGSGGGALLGAGSEAVGVAVGYSRLKGQIQADWKKREVREALRLAEEGFILPSDDPRVVSRKPFEQLPAEHQEVLTDFAKLATLSRLTRELKPEELIALGFQTEPSQGASAEERNAIGMHNWERMIQLSEGRAGYNPYRLWAGDYLDEVREQHPSLAQTFDQYYGEAKDHYKNLYKHAPHVTFNVASDRVTTDSELLAYITEVIGSIASDTTKTETLKQLEHAFPAIEIIMQNPHAREKLTNYLENKSGNTGRFRKLFDIEDLPVEMTGEVSLNDIQVKKKKSGESLQTFFSLAT